MGLETRPGFLGARKLCPQHYSDYQIFGSTLLE